MAKQDHRVWREGMRASVINDIVAIQNMDRHLDTPKRRAYMKAYRKRYREEAPARRVANPTAVCMVCWQLKATDGSDGGGGFGARNETRIGWDRMCKPCRVKARRERREQGKAERV